jgi:hypothetical protein
MIEIKTTNEIKRLIDMYKNYPIMQKNTNIDNIKWLNLEKFNKNEIQDLIEILLKW